MLMRSAHVCAELWFAAASLESAAVGPLASMCLKQGLQGVDGEERKEKAGRNRGSWRGDGSFALLCSHRNTAAASRSTNRPYTWPVMGREKVFSTMDSSFPFLSLAADFRKCENADHIAPLL